MLNRYRHIPCRPSEDHAIVGLSHMKTAADKSPWMNDTTWIDVSSSELKQGSTPELGHGRTSCARYRNTRTCTDTLSACPVTGLNPSTKLLRSPDNIPISFFPARQRPTGPQIFEIPTQNNASCGSLSDSNVYDPIWKRESACKCRSLA